MADFQDSKTALVADVDCTAGGKDLCEKHDVRGYPSIKHGTPGSLEDYNGGRTYDELKTFADENLGPSCSPDNMDLCDEEKKAELEKFMKMSTGKIDAKVRKADKDIAKLESDFEAYTKTLQEKYSKAEEKKDGGIKEIKDSGLGLMKAVLAHMKEKNSEL
jgi:hypothetical protein